MSDLGRIGIWSIELRTGGAEAVADAAAELDALGYRSLWIPGLSRQGAPRSSLVTGRRLLSWVPAQSAT